MKESRTLEYETPHFLHALFAGDLSLIKRLASRLEVHATSRDGWLKLDGEPAAIDRACQVMTQLEESRRQGTDITEELFDVALDSVVAKPDVNSKLKGESLKEVQAERLNISSGKPPVVAKTHGQLQYLQVMHHHDVVFGVGPAGTGKTYLAMARPCHCSRMVT